MMIVSTGRLLAGSGMNDTHVIELGRRAVAGLRHENCGTTVQIRGKLAERCGAVRRGWRARWSAGEDIPSSLVWGFDVNPFVVDEYIDELGETTAARAEALDRWFP